MSPAEYAKGYFGDSIRPVTFPDLIRIYDTAGLEELLEARLGVEVTAKKQAYSSGGQFNAR